ncbi:MAG: hypothetical protein ABSF83_02120 [Nitrososphaerales archaeon]|jgi:hypothetical protein
MRRSRGVSGFVATLLLVSISLSLSYVVYEGVSRLTPPSEAVFSNQSLALGGSPDVIQFQVNASAEATPRALEADDASSGSGILYFNGTAYGTSQRLCASGATTFFSVYASTPGPLVAASSGGATWIDGDLTGSLVVGPGWHEVMFSDARACQVTPPGAPAPIASFPAADLSAVPFTGASPSTGFLVWVPTDGDGHSLVMVFDGGLDRLA